MREQTLPTFQTLGADLLLVVPLAAQEAPAEKQQREEKLAGKANGSSERNSGSNKRVQLSLLGAACCNNVR